MADSSAAKVLSRTGEMEEQIEIFSLAVCGLYDRMLKYAGVVHDTDRTNYMEMRSLVNHVYTTKDFGFNLRKMLSDGSKRETILTALEKEYKSECIIYKEAFFDSLNTCFENELNPEFDGNTLPDMEDRLAFSALRKQAGARVHRSLVALAAGGDIDAQIIAGKSYFLGWGVPVDLDEGMHWLTLASKSGDGRALLYTGLGHETVHYLTTGFRLNPESISCYEAAYAAGAEDAPFALYRYYKYHLSDRTARPSSKKWLRRGCEEGCIPCLYLKYERPEKAWAPGNVRAAVDWIRAAAALKEPDAFTLLGKLYQKGHAGLEKNEARAADCFSAALQLS